MITAKKDDNLHIYILQYIYGAFERNGIPKNELRFKYHTASFSNIFYNDSVIYINTSNDNITIDNKTFEISTYSGSIYDGKKKNSIMEISRLDLYDKLEILLDMYIDTHLKYCNLNKYIKDTFNDDIEKLGYKIRDYKLNRLLKDERH